MFNIHHELFILFIAIAPSILGKQHSEKKMKCLCYIIGNLYEMSSFLVGIIGASMSNLLPTELLSFDYEHSKGIRTSLDRFVIHWSLLFVVLLVIILLQANDSEGFKSYDALLSSIIVIIVMMSIVFVPSSYGSRTVYISNPLSITSAAASYS